MRALFLIFCVLCVSCSDTKVGSGVVKISVITEGYLDDKSFNESAWKGAKRVGEDFGVEVIPKESTPNTYLADIEALKDSGSNFIWLIGYKLSNFAITVALENPDVRYAIIDPVYGSDEVIPDNLVAVTFKNEEGAFLAGYLAAKTSKTGKIGFLGGIEGVIINSFR
ncbi:BMP family ABC transporter substrate-binding protein, partial [Candidatus Borreliella tachyglossi]|uniref:BMP family ABC transporter substrate-binding protein n=1 Tax=Candidatus Borreliella tachyglossi TaxID=1964448 RepID=UPI001F34EE46